MKKFLSALIICFLAISSNAQKVINDPNVQIRNTSSFKGISISGGIDLYISYGTEAVAVSASKVEYRDGIKTEVKDGILKIWYDGNRSGSLFRNQDQNLKAYVSYQTLNTLSASGGCDVIVDGTLKSNTLNLNLSGGSDFTGKVDIKELSAKAIGGSDIKISGSALTITVSASGGSDFKGYDLVADVCNISASGGSDVQITANKELSASASGASDITYKGKPVLKEVKASGASSVSQRS